MTIRTKANTTLGSVFRTLVALLIAAAVPAIVVTFFFTVSARSTRGSGIAFLIAFAFTAAHALVLGSPSLLLGIRLHAIRWWSCLLFSFLIGFIPSAWASGASFLDAWPMGILGAIGGLTFWLLWHFWVRRSATGAGPEPQSPHENLMAGG